MDRVSFSSSNDCTFASVEQFLCRLGSVDEQSSVDERSFVQWKTTIHNDMNNRFQLMIKEKASLEEFNNLTKKVDSLLKILFTHGKKRNLKQVSYDLIEQAATDLLALRGKIISTHIEE